MSIDGYEKTWDQCKIKLKNLKSQYRFVKERIPGFDELNFDNEEAFKQLVSECHARGISPSNVRHIRSLRSFMTKLVRVTDTHVKSSIDVRTSVLGGKAVPLDGPSKSVRIVSPTPGVSSKRSKDDAIEFILEGDRFFTLLNSKDF